MHSTSNLDDGYFGSGKVLKRSLNKYGKKNHSIEILEWFLDRSSLKTREAELVNESLVSDPLCMNLQLGGGGGFVNEDHLKKCSIAGGNGHSSRMKFDDLYKHRVSNTARETMKTLHSKGLLNNSSRFSGKNHTAETKLKLSELGKNYIGEKNSQFGTRWITNGDICIKIKSGESIPNGWKFGRK